jgi:hypothetical protein
MHMEKSEVRRSKREPDPPSSMKFPDWRKDEEEEEEIEKKTLKSEVNAPWRNLKQEEAREN